MIRTLLTLLFVVLLILAVLGMRSGWRRRGARQSYLPELPVTPNELGESQVHAAGLYVGTTMAASWQDRVVHAGLGIRSGADADLYPAGLLVRRQGADDVFVPASSWVEARLAPGLAGKVMGSGGLLVVRWRLGDTEVDTGFRADDKTSYPDFVRAINAKVSQ